MQRHTLAALVIAALSITAAQPALAAAPQTTIRHADLDLAKPADAAIMLKRIRHAAVDVCQASEPSTTNDIGTVERFDACYRQTIVRAVASLDASLVTAAADRQGFTVQPALLAQNAAR